jgi:GNAT superfamily N-acetyltransferase
MGAGGQEEKRKEGRRMKRGPGMGNYALISDYFDNEKYMTDLNRLGREIFTMDCEDWYRQNLYYGRCRFFSLVDGDRIVSNVSVSEMDLLVGGKSRKALQIGAVMTRREYRKKGLSAGLMNHVLGECRERGGTVFLFANETVLDFYPKFGFEPVRETVPVLRADRIRRRAPAARIRKLNPDDPEDRGRIFRIVPGRRPVSRRLGVLGDSWPLMAYCLSVFRDDLYFFEEEDLFVVARRDGGALILYDVVASGSFDLDGLIEGLVAPEDREVDLCFMPELRRYSVDEVRPKWGETLFVLPPGLPVAEPVFPVTSHT